MRRFGQVARIGDAQKWRLRASPGSSLPLRTLVSSSKVRLKSAKCRRYGDYQQLMTCLSQKSPVDEGL